MPESLDGGCPYKHTQMSEAETEEPINELRRQLPKVDSKRLTHRFRVNREASEGALEPTRLSRLQVPAYWQGTLARGAVAALLHTVFGQMPDGAYQVKDSST